MYFVEAEHEMEHILMKIGINCPVPELNIHGKEYSMEKIYRKKCNEKEADNGKLFYEICLFWMFGFS